MPVIAPGDFARLRDCRAFQPELIADAFAKRRRREVLRGDGRLFIVAADHPARGALSVGVDRMAMADRYQLLERLALALSHPGVDGVLATADIIDDLAVLGVLDDKVVVGSIGKSIGNPRLRVTAKRLRGLEGQLTYVLSSAAKQALLLEMAALLGNLSEADLQPLPPVDSLPDGEAQ